MTRDLFSFEDDITSSRDRPSSNSSSSLVEPVRGKGDTSTANGPFSFNKQLVSTQIARPIPVADLLKALKVYLGSIRYKIV